MLREVPNARVQRDAMLRDALAQPEPFVSRSREYFVDVTAGDLAAGVPVYTVGVGTEGVAPVPVDDPVFGLDGDLDWSTFRLTEVNWGDYWVDIPPDTSILQTRTSRNRPAMRLPARRSRARRKTLPPSGYRNAS